MASTVSNIEQVLIQAIHKEESAHRFYLKLAGLIKNPEGAKIFTALAGDEAGHRQKLETWWAKSVQRDFPFSEDLVTPISAEVDTQTGAVAALDLALDAERKAANAYEQLATETDDEQLRKLCKQLAQEEWGHFDTISAEKNAIIDSYYWFDVDNTAYVED